MVIIPIRTVGDFWYNENEVSDIFSAVPKTETITLDLCHEGPSIQAIGLLDRVLGWCHTQDRDISSVQIDSPNNIESTVLKNINQHTKNHFFQYALQEYPRPMEPVIPRAQLFAFFVGRHTLERQHILDTIQDRYQDHFLLSVMRGNQPWDQRTKKLPSLDNHSVQDQYVPNRQTNNSILKFYDRFEIELAAETFTAGTTFFPTEKTLRPIMGSKPILVFGPKNFLANLRRLGFLSFSTLWDEYYDRLQGIERWQAMTTVIDSIIEHGYDRVEANRIAKWNHQEIVKLHC